MGKAPPEGDPQPPRLAEAVLALLLPARDRDPILGDVAEEFNHRVATHGTAAARRWYWRHLIRSALPSLRRRLTGTPGVSGTTRGSAPTTAFSWLDIKLGLRMLVRQPGLTLVAVLSLAIGIPIGLVPAHFSNAIEAPLPVSEGDRILVLRNQDLESGSEADVRLEDFVQWKGELTSFETLAATTRRASFNVITADGRAAPAKGAEVTASAFRILRVAPVLGRTLIDEDETPGAPQVVVIGHDFWQSRLLGAPDVIGSTLRIGGIPHSVVGVMPEGFLFPYRSSVWLPLRVNVLTEAASRRPAHMIFGRLSHGVSIDQAQAEVATAGQRLALETPDEYGRLRAEVVPFATGFFVLPKGDFGSVLVFRLIQLAALLVLIIACANVGMLAFTRTVTRAGELAIRTALGASRTRIVLQLFTETLIFAVLAAGAGLVLGEIASIQFDMLLEMLPYWVDFGITPRTVVWALSLAVLSAGVIGVVPALKVTGKRVQQNIQQAQAGRSGVRFGGMSSALIVADVTLAVATVALGVGLLDGITVTGGPIPLETDAYLSASLSVPGVSPLSEMTAPERSAFEARLADIQSNLVTRLEAEPGVRGVAVASALPGMDHPRRRVEVEGMALPTGDVIPSAWVARVDPSYFDAMEHPILTGRNFVESDLDDPRSAIIVNTGFVDQVLEGRNAIGQRVRYVVSGDDEPGPWYTVVGVVGSLGMSSAEVGRAAGLYHPLAPGELHPVLFAIHVGSAPAAFASRLRTLAGEVDPVVVIDNARPLAEIFSFNRLALLWVKRGAWTLFGVLLALSISGVYALMSFTVSERTREIGIRTALGADRRSIVLTLARRSLLQLGIGSALGVGLAWVLLTALQLGAGRLPTYSPLALSLGLGMAVTLVIGLLACVAPTRRALRIAPTEALHG